MNNATYIRLKRLRKSMNQWKIPALLVNNLINQNYISGFTGTESLLLITKNKSFFITDFRYIQQAKKQVKGFEIIQRPLNKSIWQIVIDISRKYDLKYIGFEADSLTYQDYLNLKIYGRNIKFYPTVDLVKEIRIIKDSTELKLIQKSMNIALRAFQDSLNQIKPGISEKNISNYFENKIRYYGGDSVAFNTIVASGWRSALPHGVASNKKIKKNELLVFDFGAIYQGYCSDCTRTFILGKPTKKQQEIYAITLEAQEKALAAIRPGITCRELDFIARDIISKAGYGDNFGHGLGHGLGRSIHELPRLNQYDNTELKPGMVITIEPGIYLDKIGGVRIEDLVIITEKGAKILTPYPKNLISLTE